MNRTPFRHLFPFFMLLLLTGCQTSQDSIDLAVCQTRMAEPTSTPVVEIEIQTVEVEITRKVVVTREVQVTTVIEKEVTRIVQVGHVITKTQLITLTPLPTLTPSPTPTPVPYVTPVPTVTPVPAVSTTSKEEMLQVMRITKEQIGTLGFLIDQALDRGWIECEEFNAVYAEMLLAPTYANLPAAYQTEYNDYRQSIDIVEKEGTDMVGLCKDLISGVRDQPISPFVWTRVRTGVNEALDLLNPAIERLENK